MIMVSLEPIPKSKYILFIKHIYILKQVKFTNALHNIYKQYVKQHKYNT